jgi:type III secretory pathway component EscS
MIVIFGVLAALGPWLGGTLLSFAEMCFSGFPEILF